MVEVAMQVEEVAYDRKGPGTGQPVSVARRPPQDGQDSSTFTVFDVSENLRRFGWIVPAYTMPSNAEHVAILRVVVREDFSRSLAERLVSDIVKVLHELDARAAHAVKVASVAVAQSDDGVVARKSVLAEVWPES
ncbi:hypothetical protein PR202_ga21210 [Eleusine coracana subsp. coracana]|uniref:Glutamate decarboxylase n=1 Tax=Eleusine coracana subsp. coracana TaxID=191504 RepID=A0AAV5CYJ8_ELECO|nr:hypothetical protein PR202_ga21210 [Eleusine coracana subsp. coracana]